LEGKRNIEMSDDLFKEIENLDKLDLGHGHKPSNAQSN